MSLSIYERAALALKRKEADMQPLLDAIQEIGNVDLSGVEGEIAAIRSTTEGHRGEFEEFIVALAGE